MRRDAYIVRWPDFLNYSLTTNDEIDNLPLQLTHLNPLFQTAPPFDVELGEHLRLMAPVASNGVLPPDWPVGHGIRKRCPLSQLFGVAVAMRPTKLAHGHAFPGSILPLPSPTSWRLYKVGSEVVITRLPSANG